MKAKHKNGKFMSHRFCDIINRFKTKRTTQTPTCSIGKSYPKIQSSVYPESLSFNQTMKAIYDNARND